MKPEIEHVVFDIGRVLLHWDAELIYENRITNEQNRKWFLENVCTPEWNLARDRGESFADGERQLIEKFPEHEDDIRAFKTDWDKSIPHTIEGTSELMMEMIERGVDLTLLTNFSAETYPRATARFPFLKRARGVTVSGEVKMLKPDRAIYQYHQTRFDLTPDKTLFIDDSEKNIAGARDFGWHAIQFTNAKTLKNDLERFAITAEMS